MIAIVHKVLKSSSWLHEKLHFNDTLKSLKKLAGDAKAILIGTNIVKDMMKLISGF